MYGSFVDYRDFGITQKQVRQAVKELNSENDPALQAYENLGLPTGLALIEIHCHASGLEFIDNILHESGHNPADFSNLDKFKFMVIADSMIS